MRVRPLLALAAASLAAACAAPPPPSPVATAPPAKTGERPAASCDARTWPRTAVTCVQARDSASLPGGSGGEALIWLTTLGAVDAAFHPARQTAATPTDASTPVWVFVLGANPGAGRLLWVTDATSAGTATGDFVYLYRWDELGSPALPAVMPPIATAAVP